jgi:carbonic anhydrase
MFPGTGSRRNGEQEEQEYRMLDQRSKHLHRAAGTIARLAGLMSLSVLTGGCMFLPFGGSGKPRADAALRPEFHEVAANSQSDCLAQDETIAVDASDAEEQLRQEAVAQADATANAPLALNAPACAACGCKATSPAADQADVARAQTEGAPLVPAPAGPAGFSPAKAGEEVLQRFMDGNKRFVEGESENTYQWPVRPGAGAAQEERHAPVAMVLACSDWETQPEAAFDARPGELYIVRVAGNMADDAVIHSAKFAVQRYNIPLIIVLGHENCGAVGAGMNLDVDAAEGEPAAHKIAQGNAADKAADEIHANVDAAVNHLREDGALGSSIAAERLRVVGAYYDETNGQITLQPEAAITPAASEYVKLPKD